jgi:hypothetical protein
VPHAPPRPAPDRRRALALATVFGGFGVASLPLALAYPSTLAPYLLALAATASVAVTGEATGRAWLRNLGVAALLVGASAPVLGFGLVLASYVVLGPLAVVLLLGPAIRQVDPFAGTAFLSACAIVIAGGFAAGVISPPIVTGVTVLVLAGGTVTTVARLLDPDHDGS